MTEPQLVTADDLNAYVDGQLPDERRAEVVAWIAANADAAATVAAYRAQRQALQEALEPILREPVPARLLAAAQRQERPLLRWTRQAATVLLLVGAGAGGGWYVARASQPELPSAEQLGFGERAAMAHVVYAPEVRHPVEVAADDQTHLVAWLSKRLGTKLKMPVLAPAGFDLVGGRLLPDARSPAAQFMYQDSQGRRVTLYVRVDEVHHAETAFRWVREGQVEVCFWMDGSVGYALSGEFDRKEIYRLAKLVYQQLNG